eukprot:TRINITY_DN11453_c0_g1_i4.p1 TRINITY_DN11453_c0_g1~~TRINITY_DN11453_c0_g1_i4.p1  ORF type:complete len:198 (-),score=62.85 TRINITY_DN11453_c0_g1_i4:140-733(-)
MAVLNESSVRKLNQVVDLEIKAFEKAILSAINLIINRDVSNTLSDLIEVDKEKAEEYIQGLSEWIIYLTKIKASEKEINNLLDYTNLTPSQREVLLKTLPTYRDQIRRVLFDTYTDDQPAFEKVEWRLDMQVASRRMDEELIPRIFVNISTRNPDSTLNKNIMETDYATLKHIVDELGLALKVSEKPEFKKLAKLSK